MQTPDFWSRKPGLKSLLLSPLGALYAAGTKRRLAKGAPERLSVPVICVGNLNAGGTGKTPVCIWLAMELSAMGMNPHIVSRGYGGKLEGPVRVNGQRHSADEVGDEPLLLSAFAPVTVAKDRAAGAKAAIAEGAGVIILDDGFQNPALETNFAFVVVDAKVGFGNGRCIPAGPLREPISAGLPRATALLRIGDAEAQADFDARWQDDIMQITPDLPQYQGHLETLQTGMDWDGMPVFAFAGIGRPEKFFKTLKDLGADLIHAEALADHQPLSDRLMSRLLSDAKTHGAQLVTTEKDAARLPQKYRQKVLTLPVRLQIEGANTLKQSLIAAINP
ncbi:tetraacyldisaccharide 4'-kinase [Thalassobius sp. I31.1]|uniref:tetraacyldisaccharide 4'-kinase n=1 Tax=Thalassobius sp. I31.1 TaxID=2109912 RepID=UPI000D1B688D|nr:tetraacyldisaccharide 4'-kinase [Thalassobius sp. I31.1]